MTDWSAPVPPTSAPFTHTTTPSPPPKRHPERAPPRERASVALPPALLHTCDLRSQYTSLDRSRPLPLWRRTVSPGRTTPRNTYLGPPASRTIQPFRLALVPRRLRTTSTSPLRLWRVRSSRPGASNRTELIEKGEGLASAVEGGARNER